MKKWFRRHAAPFCMLVCILIMAGVWIGVRCSADAGTYHLKNIAGDAAYLNGVTIDMCMEDGAHAQYMTLDNGALSHSYQYTMPLYRWELTSYVTNQSFVEHEEADVKVETNTELANSDDDYEIWLTRMTRTADLARVSISIETIGGSGDVGWAQVVTDVTVHDESYPFVFGMEREKEVYKNQISANGDPLPDSVSERPFYYTNTEIHNNDYLAERDNAVYNEPLYTEAPDGTVFFAPTLRTYHKGISAIYRVDQWGGYGYTDESVMVDDDPVYLMYTARPVGVATPVVTFPVNELRTVALDVVDDRLCLLLIENGELILHVYSMDGILEYETPLFEYAPRYGIQYELYTNTSGGSTMLCYQMRDGFAYDPETGEPLGMEHRQDKRMFCIELGDQAVLRSVVVGRDASMRCAFIDGRWVLVEAAHVSSCLAEFPLYMPTSHYVSVLDDKGNVLYQGEIVTDAGQDAAQYYLADENSRYVYRDYTVSRGLYCEDIKEG